jgi:sec-independent protein translocase protein TatC
VQIRIALITGVKLAAPIWIYQIWVFAASGRHRRERKWTILFAFIATPFFAAWAALAIKILPSAVKVLIGYTPSSFANLIKLDDYLDFVTRLILLVGFSFELPHTATWGDRRCNYEIRWSRANIRNDFHAIFADQGTIGGG